MPKPRKKKKSKTIASSRTSVKVIRFALCILIISILAFLNTTEYLTNYLSSLFIKKDLGFVVCIDPGHGGYDTGTRSPNGISEKNINLSVALKLGQILENNNIKVIYTRSNDTILGSTENEDLARRVEISRNSNAYMFVSIHCNSCKNPYIKGIELWCHQRNTKSDILAKGIRDALFKLNYTGERDIKYSDTSSLYVLRNTTAIATLVEIGYLSNLSDRKFISSEIGQSKCAGAIANAILEFKKNNYVIPKTSK